MAEQKDSQGDSPQQGGWFAATRWTELIEPAAEGASPEASAALEELCRLYWYPLYAYVRRRGYSAENAEDLTQGFFQHILERDFLRAADRKKGKFRSFLLASLNYYLSGERDRAEALKRGGGKSFISLDEKTPEERYVLEPVSTEASPEMLFERRWAITVLEQAQEHLREEHARTGKTRLFDQLKPFLDEETALGDYQRLAGQMGMSPGALATAVSRFRHSYRKCVRDEIERTVGSQEEIESELRHLRTVLSSVRGDETCQF